MKQLDLFSIIDNNIALEEDNSLKIVEVEIIKTYDSKAILTFRDRGAEEEIKKNITEYFERVKNILGIKSYKFLTFKNEEE
ncbi:MAG: hypothetical protein E7D27_03520 [Clostridium celatum]|nr:hypothetical protein [Clostridium celatum]